MMKRTGAAVMMIAAHRLAEGSVASLMTKMRRFGDLLA
jgi:hypothetical protein